MNKMEIDNMINTLPVFGGDAGEVVLGLQSLTFPTMLQACRFVDYHKLTTVAWIEDTEDGRRPGKFNEPVTIQVDTRR
ncbi:hypothetical protein SEA_YARA_81 [Streptomyces phage Yara]|nr:hypothetical protein SEA_YARA_81 [Streptomyces phage Yara]